jgi:hypothetical protein
VKQYSDRTRRLAVLSLSVCVGCLGLGGVAWSQGYVSFDIHSTSNPAGGNCSGVAACQLFQGSIYVPLTSPPTTETSYNFGIGSSNAINGFYLVSNSGFTDMISSTATPYGFSTTEKDAVNFGLGAAGNSSARSFAGTLTYVPGSGWFVSSVSFGFTASGGTYWLEGTTNQPSQGGTLDIHASTESGGLYSRGNQLISAGIKTECMPSGSPYCETLASNPILNPEINAGGLPKVFLLLGSLYAIRRHSSSRARAHSA